MHNLNNFFIHTHTHNIIFILKQWHQNVIAIRNNFRLTFLVWEFSAWIENCAILKPQYPVCETERL